MLRAVSVECRFCCSLYLQRAQYSTNKWRAKQGLGPRFSSGPLVDTPEFSFVDGRGHAPLNFKQRNRYLRDKHFTEQIVKYMKQFEIAKNLAPNDVARISEKSESE